ncbi:MAG: peptide chain release factor N(5)-glutamine methyltransferase [Desulfopila sp.]
MQLSELVQQAIAELQAAGVTECENEVYWLLGHCLGMSRTQLLLAAGDVVQAGGERMFLQLVARRKKREPLAYIIQEQEFWSLPFFVDPAVLIPRPETEFLLESALAAQRHQPGPPGLALDLCCGSGVIAVVLARELGQRIVAVDVSAKALAVTRINCRRHGVENLVMPIRGDLLTAFLPNRSLSLVVANPPYVATSALLSAVAPEVRDYEPHLALDGGEHGLDLIYRIRQSLPRVLAPGGQVFMEIGYDQGERVAGMFAMAEDSSPAFTEIRILPDYAGRDRVLAARIR